MELKIVTRPDEVNVTASRAISHLSRLPAGWRRERLDAVTEGVFDCPHSTPHLTSSGPFVARSQDIRGGRLSVEGTAHVSLETYRERIARAEPRYGDLLFSREGTYFGIAAEVPAQIKVCLGQRMVLIRSITELVDFRFLRFWLNSPTVAAHVDGFRDGSVAERLNLPTIRSLPVVLPPLAEQLQISKLLGALDDRTESNRRTSETLEAMARALFKSWFVDFDPVQAKNEGLTPIGMNSETAKLFPSSFDSVRRIPYGWRLDSIGDAVTVVGGSTPSTTESSFWNGRHRWVRPKDLSDVAVSVLTGTERTITDAGLATISSGLLPAGTVLLSSRAPIGYLVVTRIPVAINQGFIAMKCTGDISPYYVLNWTRTAMDEIKGRAGGTTFPEISKQAFRPIQVLVPTRDIVQAFESIVAPMYEKIAANVVQSELLAELRDTLLPKLMSGELRIKDAEKLASDAL
ncbi:MAG: restriction endonuclease subunit S [Byssovorax sp.]